MKILHVSMQGYLDGWGYQENLLPEYMASAGHSVTMVSSANHFPSYLKKEERDAITAKGYKYLCGNVTVYRIKDYITTSLYTFYVSGLSKILNEEKPDVIFHHDVNSSSLLVCWAYCLKNRNVKLFVDNHADLINQSSNRIWNWLVPHGLLRICIKLIQKRVTRFFGVTPGRCQYLHVIYGASESKIELLPIGCDTAATDAISYTQAQLRSSYNIPEDAIVIVSGGKMGADKGTISLIESYKTLKDKYNVYLLLFGRFTDTETQTLAQTTEGIVIDGWCKRTKTLSLLKMADIACWPIHHTTLIEDALASSLPLVIRKTPNTSHSVDKNGVFLSTGSKEEITEALEKILKDLPLYKRHAINTHDKFSYSNQVRRIEDLSI